MTSERSDPPTTTEARQDRVAYHRDRAVQEKLLAQRSKTEAARAAHLLLADQHLQMMASAEFVVAMTDPEMPQSSSLQVTGWLMRQSYSN